VKILLVSYSFWPTVGGIETVSRLLADQWHKVGHQVIVVTQTPAGNAEEFPYEVVRHPTKLRLFRLNNWADIFFQNNISLRFAWPQIVRKKPFFITHQTWLSHGRKRSHPAVQIKRFVAKHAKNIAISKAICDDLNIAGTDILPNPYDDSIFFNAPSSDGKKDDFLFVGRLVPDKGVDIFIRALGELHAQGLSFKASVVGDGPIRQEAIDMVNTLGLNKAIRFLGALNGHRLAGCYRAHRILVVPSRWNEPFGIVAVEGGACGCFVVGSSGGGLPEAIGPCGTVFPNGSVRDLAALLNRLTPHSTSLVGSQDQIKSHCSRMSAQHVASSYVEKFRQALVNANV
jgi:glycogen(starch) synthase